MAPDQLGPPGQRAGKRERAAVRPPLPLRREPFRVKAAPVPLERLARTAALVRGVGEPAERCRQIPQGGGPERVDTALARALRDDDAGPLKGLQVLGRLRLARLGEPREDTDRAGPLGQQAHEPPAGRVGQCDEECVHEEKYSS